MCKIMEPLSNLGYCSEVSEKSFQYFTHLPFAGVLALTRHHKAKLARHTLSGFDRFESIYLHVYFYMHIYILGAMMIAHITYRNGLGRISNQPSRLIGIRPGSFHCGRGTMACRFVPPAVVARALGDRRLRFDDCRACGVPTYDQILWFL